MCCIVVGSWLHRHLLPPNPICCCLRHRFFFFLSPAAIVYLATSSTDDATGFDRVRRTYSYARRNCLSPRRSARSGGSHASPQSRTHARTHARKLASSLDRLPRRTFTSHTSATSTQLEIHEKADYVLTPPLKMARDSMKLVFGQEWFIYICICMHGCMYVCPCSSRLLYPAHINLLHIFNFLFL